MSDARDIADSPADGATDASGVDPDRSSGSLIARLSLMMFLEYWPLGVWGVTFPTFLAANTGDAGEGIFSASFVGDSGSAGAIGGLVAPALIGWIADRYWAPKWVLAMSHAGCGAAVLWIYQSHEEWAVYAALLLYFLMFAPTVGLTNSIAMASLRQTEREFPTVRLFGTVAWIAAGVFIGVIARWWLGESIEATRVPMAISVVSHALMTLYSLTLPGASDDAVDPDPEAANADQASQARQRGRLLRSGAFVTFLLISVFAAAPSMSYNLMNLFMNERGYEGAAATLTMGQVTEVLCFIAMPALLARFGLKVIFLVGVLGWVLRYGLLALGSYGGPDSTAAVFVYAAIIIHGPCYAFVYIVGQMYVDRLVPASSRSAAQGLHTIATGGFGHLIGARMVGWSQATFLTPEGVTPAPYRWPEFWLVPIVIGVVTAAVFAAVFSERKETSKETTSGEKP